MHDIIINYYLRITYINNFDILSLNIYDRFAILGGISDKLRLEMQRYIP